MTWSEINTLMKYDYYVSQDSWEQSRLVAYMIAQVNSRKRLKFDDIMKFPWEEANEIHDTTITKEDIERLKMKAQKYLENKKDFSENSAKN